MEAQALRRFSKAMEAQAPRHSSKDLAVQVLHHSSMATVAQELHHLPQPLLPHCLYRRQRSLVPSRRRGQASPRRLPISLTLFLRGAPLPRRYCIRLDTNVKRSLKKTYVFDEWKPAPSDSLGGTEDWSRVPFDSRMVGAGEAFRNSTVVLKLWPRERPGRRVIGPMTPSKPARA